MKKSKEKYLLYFWATLFPVMAEYSSDITDTARKLPRKEDTTDSAGYISKSDENINGRVRKLRNKIYATISTKEFCCIYPEMRKIIKLPHTDFKKIIIFMAGMEIGQDAIRHTLISSDDSIRNLLIQLDKDIKSVFPDYQRKKKTIPS